MSTPTTKLEVKLNPDCWRIICDLLDYRSLLRSRLVCSSWCEMTTSIVYTTKSSLAIFGPSPESHRRRSQLPIGRANCNFNHHQIHPNDRLTIKSINSWSHWRSHSDSMIHSLSNLLPSLRVLMLDCFGFWLTADQWRLLGSSLTLLEHLNVLNCTRLDEIVHFKGPPSLVHFEIHHCFFVDPKKMDKFLISNQSITSLIFQGSEDLEINLTFCPSLVNQLSSVSLIGSYLGTTFITNLTSTVRSNATSSLTVLRVSFVTNKQLALICSALAHSLQIFEFWSNIVEIRNLSELTSLQQLTFSCTGTRSSNFNQDLSLMTRGTPALVCLAIKCPFIDDTSTSIISINCPSIVTLRLIGCNLRETSSISLRHLTRLKSLEFIEITNTKIDCTGLNEFIDKMSSTQITMDGLNPESFKMINQPQSNKPPERIIITGEANYERFNFVLPMPMIPRM
uniref:F-box domain-containing protein n=1 Tax=Tetranychus urticae TaxID=32264 RepID=T1JSN7_TETUR